LLVLGVGAAVGPLLGALTMEIFGARSVFLFIAGILTLFLLFALVRIREGEAVPVEDQSPFEPVVLTSASTILDPWVEPEESGTSA